MTDDERDQRIGTLTDAIAETNRNINALGAKVDALIDQVDALTGVVEKQGTQIAQNSTQVDALVWIMRQHLIVDHGYDPGPDVD